MLIARLLKRILPLKIYKLIANGFIIIPKYYKNIIDDTERYMSIASENNPKKDILLIRKYAHILDKGLHRKDAEPGHSTQIYTELKSLIDKLSNTDYREDPSYQWAKYRLDSYELLQINPEKFIPLQDTSVTHSQVTYEMLAQLIRHRRSCREFREQIVEDNEINQICNVIDWAASSCNKQPLKVFVTNNPDLARECLKQCKGGTGFSDFIPSFWVITANCRGYVWPYEIMLPTLDASLGLQNILLASHTLGISGTILSWAQKSEEEERCLRNLLSIPKEYIIVCCLVMGRPLSNFSTPSRKNTELSIVHSTINC